MFGSDKKKKENIRTAILIDSPDDSEYLYFKQRTEQVIFIDPKNERVKSEETTAVRGYSRTPHR